MLPLKRLVGLEVILSEEGAEVEGKNGIMMNVPAEGAVVDTDQGKIYLTSQTYRKVLEYLDEQEREKNGSRGD